MEDFVPFELAVKLKEKGFDYPCIGHYVNSQLYVAHYQNAFHSDNDESIDAPTISQVLKWLREECGIFILVEPDILSPEYKLTFTLRVKFYIKGEEDEGFSERYLTYRRDSYEQATLAGIEYVLDNLI